MPTRGEMMQMVKGIAEHVLQSLQTLLMILLNQVATQVSEQEVPTAHQSGVDDERTPARSSQSEGADRRAGRNDEGESVSSPKSRDSQCHDRERFGVGR